MSVKYAKLRCARSALAPLALDLHLLQVDWRCAHRCRRKDGLVEVDCAQRLSTHSWAASRNHVSLPPIVLTGLARHVVVEYVCVSNRVGLCVTCVCGVRAERERKLQCCVQMREISQILEQMREIPTAGANLRNFGPAKIQGYSTHPWTSCSYSCTK